MIQSFHISHNFTIQSFHISHSFCNYLLLKLSIGNDTSNHFTETKYTRFFLHISQKRLVLQWIIAKQSYRKYQKYTSSQRKRKGQERHSSQLEYNVIKVRKERGVDKSRKIQCTCLSSCFTAVLCFLCCVFGGKGVF